MSIKSLRLVALILSMSLATAARAGAAGPADSPAAKAAATVGFSVEKLADGIFAAVRTDPPGLMVDANSLFIVNERDVVVVDAPEASAEMITALRKITDKPVSFLINTHWHDDHVIGNAVWRKAYPDVRFIAQASLREYLPNTGLNNRKQMIEGAPQFAAQMQAQMDKGRNLRDEPISEEERVSYASDIRLVKHYMEVVPGTEIMAPDIDVEEGLTLIRGNRRIEVRHLGNGHTRADLVVWLPSERIVATGDLVVWPIPLVGSDQSHVRDWPATLDALLALKPAVLLPGHGPVLHDTDYVKQERDLFASIDTQVAAAVARGDSLEAARKAVDLSAFRLQFAGESKVRQFAFGMYVTGPAVESAYRDATAKP
ncbi:MAG TPA: MBL fold metallo-hydrolase [Rhodanobacteraceae bacterium]|nr:MBL fold metallo-hydrolase [Rhodanobacteraceae bacterium]